MGFKPAFSALLILLGYALIALKGRVPIATRVGSV